MCACCSEAKTEKLVASYWHNVPTSRAFKTQVGGQVNWNLENGSKVLTVATEHELDAASLVCAITILARSLCSWLRRPLSMSGPVLIGCPFIVCLTDQS